MGSSPDASGAATTYNGAMPRTDRPLPAWGGWGPDVRDDPFPLFAAVRAECPVQPVRLADGHDAWVVLGHEAARQALNDPRISKDMLAALADDPDVVAEGLPGPAFSRHMLNVDPPDHTRLRRLVAKAFLPSRVAALEPGDPGARRRPARRARRPGPGRDRGPGRGLRPPAAVPGDLRAARRARAGPARAPRLRSRSLLRPWAAIPPPEAVRGVGRHRRLPRRARRRRSAGRRATTWSSVLVSPATTTGWTDQELLSSLFQLIVAGHDTTTASSATGSSPCSTTPTSSTRCCADLDQMPGRGRGAPALLGAGPARHLPDDDRARSSVDGVEIPAGQQVLVCLGGGEPRPGGAPGPRPSSTSPARRGRTSPSATASTSASAPRSPGSRPGSPSPRCSRRFPDLRLAVPARRAPVVPRRRPRAPRPRRAARAPRGGRLATPTIGHMPARTQCQRVIGAPPPCGVRRLHRP